MKYCFLLCSWFLMDASFAQDTIQGIQDTVIISDTIKSPSDSVNEESPTSVPVEEVSTTVAASATSAPVTKKKFTVDRVRILFGLNYSYISPLVTENDIFHGPYYPVADSSPVWADRNTKTNLSESNRSGNFQFSIQGNFWKGLFIGMNYQFFSIKNFKKDPNLGNLLSKVNSTFFIVSGQFGYVFEFLKDKTLQLHPSIRIGGFAADDYYDSGKGKKFYFGTDLQFRYLIKRKAGFSLGFDYDFLKYEKKDYSDIYQRNTYQKTTFSNVHFSAGFFVNVSVNTKK